MLSFAIGKTFLPPLFDAPLEERQNLDASLEILEDSGIGPMIGGPAEKSHRAGRKPHSPCRPFASIAYGFTKRSGNVRKIEGSLSFDLCFICLAERERPSYATAYSFLNSPFVA